MKEITMLYRMFLSLSLLALSACSGDPGEISNPNEELISEAESYVRLIAKDPDSVQFRNMQVFRGSKYKDAPGTVVCGEFNGRNGFGGYGGFEKFAFQRGKNGNEPFFLSDSMIGNGNGNFGLFFQNQICVN